jgi:hypothetical protein
MQKTLLLIAASAALIAAAPAADAAQGHFRARGATASGAGVVAGGARNGNAYVRGHGAHQNADGSVTSGSGAAFKLNNGAYGARGSTTTVNPDGSATHKGGFAASGASGQVNSSGSVSRDANGDYTGSRVTSATGVNGNTYNGSTSYSNGTFSHTGACHDASGAEIACPTR